MALMKQSPEVFVRRSGVLKIFSLVKKKEMSPSTSNDELMLELEQPILLLDVADELFHEDGKSPNIRKKLEEDLEKDNAAVSFSELFKRVLSKWVIVNGKLATLDKLAASLSSNGLPRLADMIKSALSPSPNNRKCRVSSKQFQIKEDPVNKVLSNPLVLGEVFRQLSFKDQKQFRLVSHSWWLETMKYNWRKSVWLYLCSIIGDPGSACSGWMRIKNFNVQALKEDDDHYKLLKYPYRCYKFIEEFIRCPLPVNSYYSAFWNTFGSQMTSIWLNVCFFDNKTPSTIIWILLEACSNLEEMNVCDCCTYSKSEVERCKENEKEDANNSSVTICTAKKLMRNNEAIKLKVLRLEDRPDTKDVEWKEVFKVLPNLKVFQGLYGSDMEGIQHRLRNGKFIQLEKLILGRQRLPILFLDEDYMPYLYEFRQLLLYSTINCDSSTLCHLELDNTGLGVARNERLELYQALYNFRINLKILKLTFVDIEMRDSKEWFLDLKFIVFPKLIKFDLQLVVVIEEQVEPLLFDFTILKGMPNLEQLSLKYIFTSDEFERAMGERDWIYQNQDTDEELQQRYEYVPVKILEDIFPFQHLLQNTLLELPKLKKMNFQGFPLRLEDIDYFNLWFPNLVRLEAEFERDAAVAALETMVDLKTLKVIPIRRNDKRAFQILDLTAEHLEILSEDFPLVTIGFAGGEEDDGSSSSDDDDDEETDNSE